MWYHVYRVYYVISSVSIDWNFAIASAQLLMVRYFSSIGYMKYHALSLYILWKPNAAISTLCASIFCLSYLFERKLESRNIDAKNLKREKVWARKYRNMYIYKKVEIIYGFLVLIFPVFVWIFRIFASIICWYMCSITVTHTNDAKINLIHMNLLQCHSTP